MRKFTRRRVWDVNRNPVRGAVVQAMAHDLSCLDVQLLLTVAQIKLGKMNAEDHHVALVAVNVCHALASSGIGPEALQDCRRAIAYLKAVRTEKQTTVKDADRQCLLDVFAWLQSQRQAIGDAIFSRTAAPYLVAR